MKNVLVTGASGFTGSRLTNELAARGHRVRALVRKTSELSLLDAESIATGQIQLVQGDIRDERIVDKAVAGCDQVFHVAALYRAAKHPDQTYWDVNVGGTRSVLDACQRHGVQRVLHCSTIGVHGGVKQIPATEQAPFAPGDIYQITKLEGEKLAQQAIERGQPISIVRPAGIYGPGDLRFLKLFSMVKSGRFVMFGSGQTLMHMVYIDDLVNGMIQTLEHPDGIGKTLILAGRDFVPLNELVRLVAAATNARVPAWRLPLWPLMTAATCCEVLCRPLGVEPPLHRRRAAFFTKDRAFSIENARNAIGYAPQTDLHDGLRKTAEWYAQHNLLA